MILSDAHLGTPDCKAREAHHFLRHGRGGKLILNGDIIDGWQLPRSGQWTKAHTRFIRIALKMLEKKNTAVQKHPTAPSFKIAGAVGCF